MSTVMKNLQLLSVGHAIPEMTTVVWTVHGGGMRGSLTTIIRSDLAMSEVEYDPNRSLDDQPPTRELGLVTPEAFQELTTVLFENQIDQIQTPTAPAPGSASVALSVRSGSERIEHTVSSGLLDKVPALKAVSATIARLRSAFPK